MKQKTEKPQTTAPKVNDETLRRFVGYHLKRTFNIIQADLTQTLKPFGLRMLTYTALVLIVDNPGLSQAQLAEAMGIERPNLVVIVDELEGRDLITRDRVPTDRRAYALKTTLAGRRLYDQALEAVIAHENQMLANIDDESRTRLIQALTDIRKPQSTS
ncbi:MAG: MarR family winged helix-turn-helix transcriptional regulator [Pelagimonas sp.]|uniref:MarR family winged helix-turn-helix transcriptional regulator n=1 Tax=Pelagimonas sp. TaxID=2073170 RepID=UPI003D6A39CD